MPFTPKVDSRRRTGESGSVLVEFSLVLLPLLALIFLLLDTAWLIFAKATMEEAVREATRAGVTGQLQPGCTGLNCSIRQVAQHYSMGFVNTANVNTVVAINYYAPSNLTTPITGCGASVGGNVIRVSISGLSLVPLAPLWRSPAPFALGSSSADVMEPGRNACP